ncbi:MAG: hypothetical protein H6659_05065 [Ardenticatenaceae bacterium]|nr:hypothetical protein [Anaerolineales bacterium]MCB8983171.1 hypothetical protein [Ardenticatenaceae bacterium]
MPFSFPFFPSVLALLNGRFPRLVLCLRMQLLKGAAARFLVPIRPLYTPDHSIQA